MCGFVDLVHAVEKDVDFESLNHYNCPVCDAPKTEFTLLLEA